MPISRRRPRSGDGLFIVAIVGQAGSGKSTVARALEGDGAVVIDADALGHAVTDEDPDVRDALRAEYGEDVYGPRGLDRARVAARVFRDPDARARLNRLVHPRIVARMRQRMDGLRGDGASRVVVIDAALLLDWGFEREVDAVIALVAPRAQQLERLRAQRGWDHEEAERRLAAQRPEMDYAAAADVVLHNDGSPETLAAAAREAVERLRGARDAHEGRTFQTPC